MISPLPHQQSLLSAVALTERAKEDLRSRMTAPTRHYHNLQHLELLWARHLHYRVDTPAQSKKISNLIAFAIAYHDAVFSAGASDNEERSADLWLDVSLTATDLNELDRLWVADTIRATADHLGLAEKNQSTEEKGYARQWMIDLDLTPLGESSKLFDENMDLLKAEYAENGRSVDLLQGLKHFASAKPLYRCSPIATAFEAAAHRNFERHIEGFHSYY